METGPRLKVSSDRLEKPGIEPTTPGLQGKSLIHYTTAAPKENSVVSGFYTKLNVWGSLGLNFEYDGGPIIEIGGPIFLDKLQILEGSTSFREGSVLSPGQLF